MIKIVNGDVMVEAYDTEREDVRVIIPWEFLHNINGMILNNLVDITATTMANLEKEDKKYSDEELDILSRLYSKIIIDNVVRNLNELLDEIEFEK